MSCVRRLSELTGRRRATQQLGEQGLTIELLEGDVGDPAWCDQTKERIIQWYGRLDILVLNACTPPSVLGGDTDLVSQIEDYVRHNLRLVRSPLAAFGPLVDGCDGVVVGISSAFVEDPPVGLEHYVALKHATEGAIRATARTHPHASYCLARPPKLRTSWNDTPTGVLGTIPTHRAAAQIVNELARGWEAGRVEVVSDFPTEPEVEAEQPEIDPADADYQIVVSASFTVQPLLPGLRFWFRKLGLSAAVDAAPYGQVVQELVNPTSSLSSNGRGVGVVLLRVRDWLRELPAEKRSSCKFLRSYLDTTAEQFIQAVRTHRSHAAADTILVLCPSGTTGGPEDGLLVDTEARLVEQLQGIPGLQLVVAERFHDWYDVDRDAIHDPVREEIAHIPFKDAYYSVLATVIMRHWHRKLAPVRKVVVVDCDNTLWRGVVGEVGPERVAFEDAHRELHAVLRRLIDGGMLVCLCSKNQEADVWSVFDQRPDFGLKREHIVASMINWQPKSQNLRILASRLNLGLDSFIFLDDNPVECAEVRANCPEVLTLQWPAEPDRCRRLLRHTWEFDVSGGTKEDRRRTQMYREEFRRQELKESTLSFKDFIDSLQLEVDIRALSEEDLPRTSQLTLRTNQFNFTTRRRKESEIRALVAEDRFDCWTVRVRDGDYGLVGVMIAETQPEALVVDTFLLSCRVLGRGVEHRMAAELGRVAQQRGLPVVRLRVEATKRNAPAWAFLEKLAPEEYQKRSDGVLECEIPADHLASVQFEPTADAVATPAGQPKAKAEGKGGVDVEATRRREQQIERTAFNLSTAGAISVAVQGADAAAIGPASAEPPSDVGEFVHQVFSTALRRSVREIQAVDRLDELGCDSFKIVEITVALIERFPWLPATLLFEHRCVSEIVEHISRLAASKQDGRPSARPEALGQLLPARPAATAGMTDIAVVGMAVRCAGANSPDELWELLRSGERAIRRVPAERPYFLGRLRDERPHWAGLIDDIDSFDAEFFGISPREAEFMDPQLRLFLQVAWEALEDAGWAGEKNNVDTGVYVGVMYGDYVFRANAYAEKIGSPYRCWEGFSLANRLSQILGFRGPSFAINTACSSSGTALHTACQALSAGECRAAVVGGVNLILDPQRFSQLGRLGILSPSGRCQAFGAEADGTILGEGVGVVVLRPLEDALRDGSRIYGVIKGTALSHGTGTVGFTAPNPQAQAEAIRRALRVAGVDPRTISYVETHGTGTSLGDPIEIRGLELAYLDQALWDGELRVSHRCKIGSIKPNIGHLEAGAGVISLIKVLLQFQHRELVPSPSSDELNPNIPFGQLPFDLQRRLESWQRLEVEVSGQRSELPRRAGLSSFGVGGANVHVILEEPPSAERRSASEAVERPLHVLTLSARGLESLREYARRVAAHLDCHPQIELGDLCFTANTGRKPLEERLAVVADGRGPLIEALKRIAEGQVPSGCARGKVPASHSRPKTAFLFTGQGAQFTGMGRDLYESQPVFRDVLDRCAAVLEPLLERPLLEVLFAEEGSEDAARLNQTAYTQPALFVIEYALAELWRSWGIEPDLVVGHSIGEIAALCFAGGLSLEDGLKLVAARGRLMQALPSGGAMFAARADEKKVREALSGLEDRAAIAAINSPRQTVISGEESAVREVIDRLSEEGIKSKRLVVSHAFHSVLMEPMMDEYRSVAEGMRFFPPQISLVSTVEGRLAETEVTTAEYWVRQIRCPVRFVDAARALEEQGIEAFVEVGPQPVL
ncbi:MAG: HAD-IIIC family phosphatase, partial [Planctomycetes bacterium]|nr:HAD-IIIC family phosphatase [Planctomycetota bacterium]